MFLQTRADVECVLCVCSSFSRLERVDLWPYKYLCHPLPEHVQVFSHKYTRPELIMSQREINKAIWLAAGQISFQISSAS